MIIYRVILNKIDDNLQSNIKQDRQMIIYRVILNKIDDNLQSNIKQDR